MCSLVKKREFFDRKLPFPERGEMGVTLFSRKWGFGPLSGVGGIPTQGQTVFSKRCFAELCAHEGGEEQQGPEA